MSPADIPPALTCDPASAAEMLMAAVQAIAQGPLKQQVEAIDHGLYPTSILQGLAQVGAISAYLEDGLTRHHAEVCGGLAGELRQQAGLAERQVCRQQTVRRGIAQGAHTVPHHVLDADVAWLDGETHVACQCTLVNCLKGDDRWSRP